MTSSNWFFIVMYMFWMAIKCFWIFEFWFLLDYWLFVRGTTGPRAGQWCEALIISLICTWTNGLANNQDAGYLRRHRHHRGVTVIEQYACIGRDRPLWVLNVRCLSFMITTKVSAERYCKAIYNFMDAPLVSFMCTNSICTNQHLRQRNFIHIPDSTYLFYIIAFHMNICVCQQQWNNDIDNHYHLYIYWGRMTHLCHRKTALTWV